MFFGFPVRGGQDPNGLGFCDGGIEEESAGVGPPADATALSGMVYFPRSCGTLTVTVALVVLPEAKVNSRLMV
jgi:hypothetical protein